MIKLRDSHPSNTPIEAVMLKLIKPIHQPIHQSIHQPVHHRIHAETNSLINSFFDSFNRLNSIRQWLNELPIDSAVVAHLICQIIPAQCPFARQFSLFGRSVQIPPLCQLNPFYEEIVGLRFRALCYLANECKKDVRHYC
jgi:hypothetical protein